MEETRNPLNDVQITEILMVADKKLGPYHIGLLRRLVGEHKCLKKNTEFWREIAESCECDYDHK